MPTISKGKWEVWMIDGMFGECFLECFRLYYIDYPNKMKEGQNKMDFICQGKQRAVFQPGKKDFDYDYSKEQENPSTNSKQVTKSCAQCSNCLRLEQKVQALELKIKKLSAQAHTNILSNPVIYKKTKKQSIVPCENKDENALNKSGTKKLMYSFDSLEIVSQNEENILKQIQERAAKLCQKQKKQREILRQIAKKSTVKSQIFNSSKSAKHIREDERFNRSLDLSRDSPSPIKKKMNNLNGFQKPIELIESISEELEFHKEGKNILGAEQILQSIQKDYKTDIQAATDQKTPRKENKEPIISQTQLEKQSEQIELAINTQKDEKAQRVKPSFQSKLSLPIQLSSMTPVDLCDLSTTSKDRYSHLTKDQAEKTYSTQMKNIKLMARFKRSKK